MSSRVNSPSRTSTTSFCFILVVFNQQLHSILANVIPAPMFASPFISSRCDLVWNLCKRRAYLHQQVLSLHIALQNGNQLNGQSNICNPSHCIPECTRSPKALILSRTSDALAFGIEATRGFDNFNDGIRFCVIACAIHTVFE